MISRNALNCFKVALSALSNVPGRLSQAENQICDVRQRTVRWNLFRPFSVPKRTVLMPDFIYHRFKRMFHETSWPSEWRLSQLVPEWQTELLIQRCKCWTEIKTVGNTKERPISTPAFKRISDVNDLFRPRLLSSWNMISSKVLVQNEKFARFRRWAIVFSNSVLCDCRIIKYLFKFRRSADCRQFDEIWFLFSLQQLVLFNVLSDCVIIWVKMLPKVPKEINNSSTELSWQRRDKFDGDLMLCLFIFQLRCCGSQHVSVDKSCTTVETKNRFIWSQNYSKPLYSSSVHVLSPFDYENCFIKYLHT